MAGDNAHNRRLKKKKSRKRVAAGKKARAKQTRGVRKGGRARKRG